MPQAVTLSTSNATETVIVKKAVLTDAQTRLEGFDPSQCPLEMTDGIQFVSKNLTAVILPESDVAVESVSPTDEPVPDPDPSF